MPLIRENKNPPLATASELLAFLAVNGHLDDVDMPHWMPGTSVGELFDALKSLGDGYWMEDLYDGHGSQESADRWVMEFLSGDEVKTREDLESKLGDGETKNSYGVSEVIKEYLVEIPMDAQTSFLDRMDASADFADIAHGYAEAMSEFICACALHDDAEFKKTLKTMSGKLDYADPDLSSLVAYYMDNASPVIEHIDAVAGGASVGVDKALSRVDQLRKLLNKKAGSANAAAVVKKSPAKKAPAKKAAKK